ncbi:immunoglobulin superfamily member 3-like [Pelodytes ibericus]
MDGAMYRQISGSGLTQHQVHVPPGPLLRMEGSVVSIWCNASGFSGAEFEWSLFPSYSPLRKLQVISSSDPHFSYALYRERISVRGEIYLAKRRENVALLHITHLRSCDEGEYECYTPRSAHSYYGSYSARVQLIVIPDSLRVMSLSPEVLTLQADDMLTLGCQVISGSRPHTHLSVTWFQTSEEETHPVLTLSEHSVVSAGPHFILRHRKGEARLEKVSASWYQLILSSLNPRDKADYFCQATEWIQDPDHSWYPLLTKRSSVTRVRLHSQDVMSAVRSDSLPMADPQSLLICLLALLTWTVYCNGH